LSERRSITNGVWSISALVLIYSFSEVLFCVENTLKNHKSSVKVEGKDKSHIPMGEPKFSTFEIEGKFQLNPNQFHHPKSIPSFSSPSLLLYSLSHPEEP